MKQNTIRIRSWDRWQTYRRDRSQPPWIKVHREVMRNPDWVALSDTLRGQLLALWILAADKDGEIPADPKLLQKLCYMESEPDLETLVARGFLEEWRQGDVTVASEWRQGDAPEERRGEAEEKPPVVPQGGAPQKRRTQIPEDYQPTDAHRERANKLGLDVEREVSAFVDWHLSKGTLYLDHDRAFSTWLRRAAEMKPAKPKYIGGGDGLGGTKPMRMY